MIATVYAQVSNRGRREVDSPFGRMRRAAYTESGAIIRTERFQRKPFGGDFPLTARDLAWPMAAFPCSSLNYLPSCNVIISYSEHKKDIDKLIPFVFNSSVQEKLLHYYT